MLDPSFKVAVYMEGALLGPYGKMGYGVMRYSPNPIVCLIDKETAGRSVVELMGIDRPCPIVGSLEEARSLGAEVLILGIAPPGGLVPPEWWLMIDQAVGLGFSVVNGLHDHLAPRYLELAREPGAKQFVWDIRKEPAGLKPGVGAACGLKSKRLLMIGTDMAVGKMTAGLEIAAEARRRGVKTGFVATGQIGITITGSGIPLDAIRVDFASGAVEGAVLRHDHEGAELIVIEGQGSLVHPGSTSNLPLLRGACPTHLVLCHGANQTHLKNIPLVAIPPLRELIGLYEDLASACGTFPRPRTIGVALNTSKVGVSEGEEACRAVEAEVGLPCVDVLRDGPSRLVDAL